MGEIDNREDLINYTWKDFYKEAFELFIKIKNKNMTEEQVCEGKILLDKIRSLKNDINIISQSEYINNIEFVFKDKKLGIYNNFGFNKKDYIDFKVIKTLILSSLNEELERCQKELNLL